MDIKKLKDKTVAILNTALVISAGNAATEGGDTEAAAKRSAELLENSRRFAQALFDEEIGFDGERGFFFVEKPAATLS